MKKILRIFLLAVCMIGSSCGRDFIIRGVDGEQRPVLYCFPSNLSDTTFIRCLWTKSVNGGEERTGGMENVSIFFRLNGEEKTVIPSAAVSDGKSGALFYVLGKLKEGDAVEVKARLSDGKVVSAVTAVPQAFPLKTIRIRKTRASGLSAVRFQVTLQDNQVAEDYYGMKVLYKNRYTVHYSEGTQKSVSCPLVLDTDKEPLLSDRFEVDDVFHLSDDFYQHLYIWNDRKIDGQEYTLSLDFLPESSDILNIPEENAVYKIILYALSEDLYKYLKSVNTLNNNDLGKAGLAPVHKKYTNVVNGLGIVAGCNVYETDWMEASSLTE